ncbi:MAG: hypothetical protein FJW56_01080 [Actinobacteria bacterium]|nr:hypothetical protein [Actinomycetota bacterium]
MNLQKKSKEIESLLLSFEASSNAEKRRSIKREFARLYFELEEELLDVKYRFRFIDIKQFKNLSSLENQSLLQYFSDYDILRADKRFEFTPQTQLILPLFYYLFYNYDKKNSALVTSASFMEYLRDYLKKGDFQQLNSGSIRFINNCRFASNHLRSAGLLRNTKEERYKTWELSIFGVLICAMIFLDDEFNLPEPKSIADHRLNFIQTILDFTEKLIQWGEYLKIVERLFSGNRVISYLISIRHDFIRHLADQLEVIEKERKKNVVFHKELRTYLEEIDDKFYTEYFNEGLVLQTSAKERLDQLIKGSFSVES